MKKLLLAVIAVVVLITPAFAVTFTDVPEDHWANDAVYGIVRYGVTQGYPDGTFRGTRTINRYELSVFLYNLIQSMEQRIQDATSKAGRGGAVSDKAINEMKAELDDLRAELAAVRAMKASETKTAEGGFITDFVYGARARITDVVASGEAGKQYENRVIVKALNNVNESTSVKVKYDSHFVTLPAGDVLANLNNIDAEFKTAVNVGLENPLTIRLTTGPGSNISVYNHYDDAVAFSTEIAGFGVTYENQQDFNSILLNYSVPNFGLGIVDTSVLFELYNEEVNPLSDSATRVSKVYGEVSMSPVKDLWLSFNYGAKLQDPVDTSLRSAMNARVKLGDILKTGTTLYVNVIKTGEQFFSDASVETPFRRLLDNLTFTTNDAAVYEAQLTQVLPYSFSGSAVYSMTATQWMENPVHNLKFEVGTNFNPAVKWYANYFYQTSEADDKDFVRTGMYIYF